MPDQTERLCFGIPGGLCEDCHQLYIDPDLIELLDLASGRCTFAIESDLVIQEAGLVPAPDRPARPSAARRHAVRHPQVESQPDGRVSGAAPPTP